MEDDNNLPDCLVLKIDVFNIDMKNTYMSIYLLYDEKEKQFIIRGKRNSDEIVYHSFSFNCKFMYELVSFIKVIISKNKIVKYTLYNYNNLPSNSNNANFDFFYENDSKIYELVSYEFESFNLSNLKSYLKILINVFNYYN
jgi:hypothetical protein